MSELKRYKIAVNVEGYSIDGDTGYLCSDVDAYLDKHLPKDCEWKRDLDGEYYTSCGDALSLMVGNVKDNNIEFCPYCGGVIVTDEEYNG